MNRNTLHQDPAIESSPLTRTLDRKIRAIILACFAMIVPVTVQASPQVQRTVKFKDSPRVIIVEQDAAPKTKDAEPKTLKVTVKDSSNTVLATLRVEGRKGLNSAVIAACNAVDLIGKKQTVTGCLATAGAGVCLYTGAAGGAGAAYCTSAITYAANGGAIDCVKGIAGEIAKAIGEEKSFEFYQDATFTPSDVMMRSLERACEMAKEKLKLP